MPVTGIMGRNGQTDQPEGKSHVYMLARVNNHCASACMLSTPLQLDQVLACCMNDSATA